jgi:hypothetical protein
MKKSNMLMLTVLAALLITATTNAQDYEPKSLITPEQFIEKVRGMNIPGFSGRLQFETDEEDEFQAAFSQGGEIVIITLNARHRPPTWSVSPYKLDGKDAEYVFRNGMGTLAIDLPETYSVLTIGSNKIKDKAGLEQIARQTGLMQIAPVSVAWPASIREEYRLKGVLLEASQGPDHYVGLRYMVKATLQMSAQVLESLLELMDRYEDQGDFLQFPDGTILNYPFSDIESIDEMYGENEKITFTYYVP